MSSGNFPDWKRLVSGRKKLTQILNAFQDEMDPSIRKMVCAPCSNCKGMIRDMFEHYEVFEKTGIWYTGLVEMMVNAMVDVEKPYLEWPGDEKTTICEPELRGGLAISAAFGPVTGRGSSRRSPNPRRRRMTLPWRLT